LKQLITNACHFAVCFFLLTISAYSQEDRTIDTLLQTRNTDTLGGRVKTYYSPGHQSIATELQQLVTRAITYYEKKYAVHFDIQLIVLDSSQWFKEIIPFGFVFYDGTHWLVLNSGMNYSDFKSVYGFNGISVQLDSSFSKNKIQAEDIIYTRLKFLCLHELGHYFMYKLSNAQAPDVWTNEFIATYFANEYVAQFEPNIKNGFDIFCRTIVSAYPAEYKTLAEFDSLYFKMKLGNFAWYHSRFYFLADSLYRCSGNGYFNIFQSNFPKKEKLLYNQEMIDKLIEANCTGVFSKWSNLPAN
jgi:hypothetical protein